MKANPPKLIARSISRSGEIAIGRDSPEQLFSYRQRAYQRFLRSARW